MRVQCANTRKNTRKHTCKHNLNSWLPAGTSAAPPSSSSSSGGAASVGEAEAGRRVRDGPGREQPALQRCDFLAPPLFSAIPLRFLVRLSLTRWKDVDVAPGEKAWGFFCVAPAHLGPVRSRLNEVALTIAGMCVCVCTRIGLGVSICAVRWSECVSV